MTPTHEQIIAEAVRLVDEGLSVTLPVKGRSMLPFIVDDRDCVVLQKTGCPEVGDVVLAWIEGCRYVIHRVIAVNAATVTLMGDGNVAAIERCALSNVKARVTATVDRQGREHSFYTRRRRFAWRLWNMMRPGRRFLLPVIMRFVNK